MVCHVDEVCIFVYVSTMVINFVLKQILYYDAKETRILYLQSLFWQEINIGVKISLSLAVAFVLSNTKTNISIFGENDHNSFPLWAENAISLNSSKHCLLFLSQFNVFFIRNGPYYTYCIQVNLSHKNRQYISNIKIKLCSETSATDSFCENGCCSVVHADMHKLINK